MKTIKENDTYKLLNNLTLEAERLKSAGDKKMSIWLQEIRGAIEVGYKRGFIDGQISISKLYENHLTLKLKELKK